MKKILVALATIAVSSVALAANPFQLVTLADRGALEGIPSGSALCSGNSASVSAEEVVAAGVVSGYVTAEQADSARYVRSVARHLHGICQN